MILWRLVKTRHVGTTFDGEGAFRFGGRWNNRGRRVVYASGSLSLAALEILVHLDASAPLPELSAISIALPPELLTIEAFSAHKAVSGGLPWSLAQTRAWGDRWCAMGTTPALRIPSAIVPRESNFLLNPLHPDFSRLRISQPESFALDNRLRP